MLPHKPGWTQSRREFGIPFPASSDFPGRVKTTFTDHILLTKHPSLCSWHRARQSSRVPLDNWGLAHPWEAPRSPTLLQLLGFSYCRSSNNKKLSFLPSWGPRGFWLFAWEQVILILNLALLHARRSPPYHCGLAPCPQHLMLFWKPAQGALLSCKNILLVEGQA